VGYVTFHLSFANTLSLALTIFATVPAVLIDFYRYTDHIGGVEAFSRDQYTLTPSSLSVDPTIYSTSNETNITMLRQQDPNTLLWSLYSIEMFASAGGAITTVWVNQLYVDQPAP
jgi:hypothetical protein